MRAATVAGTPWSSRNSRTARSAPWSSHDATAAPIFAGPMPGTSRRRPSGSRSTTASTSGPWRSSSHARAADPDVLDRAEVGEQRLLADGRADAHALGVELPAVAGVAAPGARDVDGLARRARGRARR